MPLISDIIQATIIGTVNGAIISVGAVGLTLSYGITNFINFAYGEFLTYGAYLTLFLYSVVLGGQLIFLPLTVISAMIIVAALAAGLSRIFFRPIADRGPFPLLLTSIGLAFALRHLLAIPARFDIQEIEVPTLQSVEVAGAFINPIVIALVAISVVVLILIHILLRHTILGKKMRAVSDNSDLARVAGIDSSTVIRRTWYISGATAALAGVLLAIQFSPFTPRLGWTFLVVLFAATILGGIGRPYGAMIGSLIIGLVMSFGSTFLASAYSMAYAFVVLVLVMLIKPEGIAGGILDAN